MTQASSEKKCEEQNIAIHIFSASSTMIGICLTGIGLLKIGYQMHALDTIADELLACDAGMFLFSSIFSYMAIRSKPKSYSPLLERIAERIFLLALSIMVIFCLLLAYNFYVG